MKDLKLSNLKNHPAAGSKMYVWELSVDSLGMKIYTLDNDPNFYIAEDYFGEGYRAHNLHTQESELFPTLEDAKVSIKMDYHIHNINEKIHGR